MRSPLVLITSFFLYGCCPPANLPPKIIWPNQTPVTASPIIGLLSDTQFQSKNDQIKETVLNRGNIDKLPKLNSALRTPAQVHLADVGLTEIGNLAIERRAEILFYLGDALNNGCKDELERFQKSVNELQKKAPVFVAIGNHDYLAAGNTKTMEFRTALCGEEVNVLTKREVAEAFDRINKESLDILRRRDKDVSYVSSYSAMKCTETEDENAGCFFAAVLTTPSVSYVLADSSHYDKYTYFNAQNLTTATMADELKGLNGWVQKSQVDFLLKNIKDRNQTVVLTHYGAPDFSRSYSIINGIAPGLKSKVGPIAELFVDEKLKETELFWFWAHTHDDVVNTSVTIVDGLDDRTRVVPSLQSGSTTDSPNFGTVVFFEGEKTSALPIMLCQTFDTVKCKEFWEKCNPETKETLGLTMSYRDFGPDAVAQYASRFAALEALDYNVNGFKSDDEMKACILALASGVEKGTNPIGFAKDDWCKK